jgi:hypothetical protein
LDEPGQQCGEHQRNDDEPRNQIHRRVDRAHDLCIPADQAGDRESEEGGDRTEQPDRRRHVHGERKLAQGR